MPRRRRAAVAVGSLNFKSQRAATAKLLTAAPDQGRRRSAGPLSLPLARPSFHPPRVREGPFEFSPLYFLRPHLSRSLACRPLSPVPRERRSTAPRASIAIMQNNYRGMRSAVSRRTLTSRACSLAGHVRVSLEKSTTEIRVRKTHRPFDDSTFVFRVDEPTVVSIAAKFV